ncbi:MAG: NFACT RNA binding domain-containing protein, partial [Candidatus Bathyarchaeia archaeon]
IVSSAGGPPFKSYIYIPNDGIPIDFSPFKLGIYRDLRCEEYPSFNAALDSYFHRLVSSEEYSEVAGARRKQAAAILKNLRRIESRIAKLESKASEYKRIADTLSMHMGRLEAIASFIIESKRSGVDEDRILEEASDIASNLGFKLVDIDFPSGSFRIEIDGCDVELSFTGNVYESISRYYAMYKRRYGEAESLRFKLEELRRSLSELESRVVEYPRIKARRRRWYEKFNFFHSSEGFLVLAGRDASTNEILVKRYTDQNDIVFHADIHGAPFVVVKTEGRIPSEATIMEAAVFAASYSQAWSDGFSSLDVFYVSPSQLSKSPPPGQYLPKGAFRILGSKNYVRSVPLELAVGLTLSEDGGFELIVAPESAVRAKTDIYVKIAPGSIPKDKLIDLVKSRLVERSRKVFEGELPIDIFGDLRYRLPAGGGRISDEREGFG